MRIGHNEEELRRKDMKKYPVVALGLSVGIISACVGFFLRFNAHELAETRTPDSSGYTSTYNLYHQSVYQELGLVLLVFGLALLFVVFYRWLKVELGSQEIPVK